MASIHVKGVNKSFGEHQVLKDLDLTINHGECFTLLGPSGCGKTVLLRLIAGFESLDSGSIRIGDIPVSDPQRNINTPPNLRGLGVVFQDYAVWPHMTVFENVGYPLKLAKNSKEEIHRKVMETIGLVNMDGLESRLPSELSGGQQQRVALARALVSRPSLMLLDEPLSNLDANLREEMRFEIKELQNTLDITVLYVTHDQEVALALSDRVAVMDDNGFIRQIGNPVEIFENSLDNFVYNFMGIANFLPVSLKNEKYCIGKGNQEIPWEKPTGDSKDWIAAFRPSDIELLRLQDPENMEKGLVKGKIKRASFLGAMMDYLVEIDGVELRTALETHKAVAHGLLFEEGEDCALRFHELRWFEAGDMEVAI